MSLASPLAFRNFSGSRILLPPSGFEYPPDTPSSCSSGRSLSPVESNMEILISCALNCGLSFSMNDRATSLSLPNRRACSKWSFAARRWFLLNAVVFLASESVWRRDWENVLWVAPAYDYNRTSVKSTRMKGDSGPISYARYRDIRPP